MRRLLSLVGLLVSIPAAPLSALAANIDAHSKIDAVTVFRSSARVTRVAELELPPGQTILTFKGLPGGLDPASIQMSGQMSGQAAGGLVLGAVTSKPTVVDAAPDIAIEARLKGLRSDREGWQVTLDALEAEKAMMLRFSQAGPEKLSPDTQPLAIQDWSKAWETVGSGLAKLGDELRSARARVRELDEGITAAEAARARPAAKPAPTQDVSVETEINAAPNVSSKARIELTYRVEGASWRPSYEARLATGGAGEQPTLEFSRRATISQATGEDWENVALTVSTNRDAGGAAAPDPTPERIVFRDAPPGAGAMMRVAPKSSASPPGPSADVQSTQTATQTATQAAPPAAPQPPPRTATQPQRAAPDPEPVTAAFKIFGRASLASGATIKRLPISSRRLTPLLSAKTAPALDQSAYLAARFANEEDAPALPGEVALYRDGSFLGSDRIDFTEPGDFFELSFGADDLVEVARASVRRKDYEPSLYAQTRTETREFKTTIENRHDFPLKITMVEAVPFSENAAISVEQLPSTTSPTEKNAADKRGVMSWTYDYAPQEKREIRLAYRIKWAADRNVSIEPAPLATR